MADLSRAFLYKLEILREGRYNLELHQTKSLENSED
jgi:hypothetical protein